MNFGQEELFEPEPLPVIGSAELNFDIVLKDGNNVSVHFERYFISKPNYKSDYSHLEFRGDAVSETGYYSYFSGNNHFVFDPDDVVIEKAKEVAEILRKKRLEEIAKEARKRKRK